jgi:hypothetical protein
MPIIVEGYTRAPRPLGGGGGSNPLPLPPMAASSTAARAPRAAPSALSGAPNYTHAGRPPSF